VYGGEATREIALGKGSYRFFRDLQEAGLAVSRDRCIAKGGRNDSSWEYNFLGRRLKKEIPVNLVRKYVLYAQGLLSNLSWHSAGYFGQPSGGFSFLNDLVTAVCQLPLILRSWGFGPGRIRLFERLTCLRIFLPFLFLAT